MGKKSNDQILNLWQEAVEYVRSNESRIKFSTIEDPDSGDFIEYVSWIGKKTGPVSYSYSKKWGGKAKTTEKIPETPQKCRALKIRDLYLSAQEINTKSKQEQLLNEIMGQVNLILEKENFEDNENLDGTTPSTKIWPSHHGFEEKAGYFRFKSEKDALNFYNALNAEWFEGRLLTPKFVQDSKYFKRFPNAKKTIYN